MEGRHIEELRGELAELLRKQNEVLESRMLGSASETELIEYEIRKDVVHQICDQLPRSAAA
jgi:outer membrane lipopolysaccharide assembly protein LptE/RlpB